VAFHPCMNRGHGKEWIFSGDSAKRSFLDILVESGKKLEIRGELKFREISRPPEFSALKIGAISSLYRYEKSKKQ
jgi:hypothetical protein